MKKISIKKTRRNILKTFAAATLAMPFIHTAKAQQVFKWKMVTSWPRNLPGPGTTAQYIADTLKKMSAGRLDITLYAAGEIVPSLEVFSAVQNGVAEMAHSASLFWGGKIPVAPLFTAAPFGLTPLEHIAWIDHIGGRELWDELYAPFGIKPFMAGNTGLQMGGWYKKELQSLKDLQGLRIRMPGLGGEVIRLLGAIPITLPPTEILTALQSGTIDATEFLGPKSDLAMGFYKVAPFYYAPGWHEPNGTAEALVSLAAYNSLPEDLQAIIKEGTRAENICGLGEAKWHNSQNLQTLVKEKNVKLRTYPDDIIKAARQKAEIVLDKLAQQDELSKKIVNSYKKARSQMNDWSKLSIEKYLGIR